MSVPEYLRTECDRIEKQAKEEWDSGLQKLREEQKMKADIQQCVIAGKVLQPIEYKVIVKPDLIEETDDVIKSARAVGIELVDSQRDKEKQRQISGTLIAVGGKAFEDMGYPMPKVGDKVYFAKYAGIVLESDDKADYRLCNDKDIAGILK